MLLVEMLVCFQMMLHIFESSSFIKEIESEDEMYVIGKIKVRKSSSVSIDFDKEFI